MGENDSRNVRPRKKVKVDHTSITNPLANQSMMSSTPAQTRSEDDRSDKEVACGITEYVDLDSSGFSGILKKRYTDFLVNEVLPSGEVVHLSNLKQVKKPNNINAHHSNQQESPGDAPKLSYTKPLDGDFQADGLDPSTDKDLKSRRVENHVDAGSVATAHPEQTVNEVQSAPPEATSTHSIEANDSASKGLPAISEVEKLDVQQNVFPTKHEHVKDPLAHHFEAHPPHLRRKAPDLFPQPKPDAATPVVRESPLQRYKVHIHFVNGGWKELTEEEEADLKTKQEREALEKRASGKDRAVIKPGEVYNPEKPPAPRPGGVASWNAFAGVKPDERLELTQEDKAILESFFTLEVVNAMRSLYSQIMQYPGRQPKSYGTVTSSRIDRHLRRQIHQEVRRIFDSKLDSQTDDNGHIVISAMPKPVAFPGRAEQNYKVKAHGRNDNRTNQAPRGKLMWTELGGDYLHFTLYKENKDTMESISWLTKQLKNKPRDYNFAGTKDRRAVTVQRVCVYRILVKDLIWAGRSLRNANIGDFEYRPDKLQLGDLAGNEFVITLRDCKFVSIEGGISKIKLDTATTIVDKSVKALNESGFIHYYGLQRFGTFGFGTDAVGIAMLQGDFNGAINGILSFRPACLEAEAGDTPVEEAISRDDRARAQGIDTFLTTGDARSALDLIPRKFGAEISIIRHLSVGHQQNDYLGALKSIQRNIRLMYVHAYQSLVWNHAASERMRVFGKKVIEGDLVLVEKKEGASGQQEELDADGEVVIHAAEDDRAADPHEMFTRARALTKEEAESGQYTIFDVVLPTPGFDMVYPANEIGEFYRTFMASDRGGNLDPHHMHRGWKDISLSGSYRKLLARPVKDIEFKIMKYTDDDEQFVETDLDRYYKAHPEQDKRDKSWSHAKPGAKDERAARNNDTAVEPESAPQDAIKTTEAPPSSPPSATESTGVGPFDPSAPPFNPSAADHHASINLPLDPSVPPAATADDSGGVSVEGHPRAKKEKIAIIVRMQLGSSTYATMALRELTKGGVKSWKGDYAGGR